MGLAPMLEGEEGEAISSPGEGDRIKLDLPKNQIEYLKKQRSYGKKPIILVLFGGSPIITKEIYDLADAVLYAWYPGEEGGYAIADVLFGDVAPSGKIPITFPMSENDLPAYEDYSMRNRTYRYSTAPPLFPFGYGLTYGSLKVVALSLNKPSLRKEEGAILTAQVQNTGTTVLKEVVQLYASAPKGIKDQPAFALKGFSKVTLAPGSTASLQFKIDRQTLELIAENGEPFVSEGQYTLYVGTCSPHKRNAELGATLPTEIKINIKNKYK